MTSNSKETARQVFERLIVAIDNVLLCLLGSVDIKNLIALFCQVPKLFLSAGFEEFYERLSLLVGVAL